MASQFADHENDSRVTALLNGYAASSGAGDVLVHALCDAAGDASDTAWHAAFAEALAAGGGDLGTARDRVQRRAAEIGSGFRLAGEMEERRWPVSPLPLVMHESEWHGIATGVAQRAALIETVIADIYGAQRLVSGGIIPPALVTGSPAFLRPMVGLSPRGGRHMRVYAADLGRGPDGEWRVLSDHAQAPVGMGYALENRLAVSRTLSGLQTRLNVARLAPFFAALRSGLAAACDRKDPRLALLTPGRFNQSYAEQAHLARYMGLVLVEGADLAVHEDQLYLRTIEGMKRVDGVWSRLAAHLADPLALDSGSQIGVPGLVDAVAAHHVAIANMPGCGVIESAAFAAFLPRLSVLLTGEELKLPNIATWWCGQDEEARYVRNNLDQMVVAPAFRAQPLGLSGREGQLVSQMSAAEREQLLSDLERRPVDYVGQEVVNLSTMPLVDPLGGKDGVVARPFTVRVFATVDDEGQWRVMPGGFVRAGDVSDVRAANMGAGSHSADLVIFGDTPVTPVSLISAEDDDVIRRIPGTLPSRVADNLYWLGRYLERGEAALALVRAAQGGGLETDQGAALAPETAARLHHHLSTYAAPRLAETGAISIDDLAQAGLESAAESSSVASLLNSARAIGDGSRERLSEDFWTLLDAPFPDFGGVPQKVGRLQERFAAFAGLASEHMGRTAGWRFHDLGRRIERAATLSRLVRSFGGDDALPDDLAILLLLSNMRISYRQRYPTGLSLARVRDLVALDPYNPRSIAYQVTAINDHFAALPRLRDDGMAEAHQSAALALQARVAMLSAADLNAAVLLRLEDDLLALSDAVGERFFLRGSAKLRASRMIYA